ncbi:T9SS type A sorting domain-containing protein [Xanthovirga aplysinae]|uniref:T9SS type A sorting domain-containing protein n=1 Tax=Xanthovirga aplysinae TaxID=2529853 RepID=UPI003CCCEFC4
MISPITGIQDLNETALTYAPNPAGNYFQIKGIQSGKTYQIKIVNTLGQTLMRREIKNEQDQIDIRSLSNGLYMVQIEGATSQHFRLIKKQ